ncbi:palmitoyltransferase for Vac8p [Loxospora ochrophaea]|nr:palmitoyltransferase for Vac8p [Loxospora ochrophaea]
MPVNYVVLCVLAGIIGLALTGFGGWHVSLAWRGQTTIECLEKTRYLSPLRKTMQRKRFGHSNSQEHGQTYGQQLAEIHTNALPGITRPEEGEELPEYNGDIENGLLGPRSSRRIYNDMERERERERYEEYLDEQDSEKLPNAFDLGWKKNLTNLFGDRPLFWALPICNTMGDGWHWDVSLKWVNAREDVRKAREAQWREQEESVSQAGWVNTSHPGNGYKHQRHESDMHYVAETNGSVPASRFRSRSPNKIDYTSSSLANGHFNGHANPNGRPSGKMAPDTTRHKSSFDYDSDASGTGNNEENSAGTAGHWYGHQSRRPADDEWREWN